MRHLSRAFLLARAASDQEAQMERGEALSISTLISTATLNAVEELQPRKAEDAPSRTGGYLKRRPRMMQA